MNQTDITSIEDLKAATSVAMQNNSLTWSVEPIWLTTPDEQSPDNQLRMFSGQMSSVARTHTIDAVAEVIFWFQARRVASDWHNDQDATKA